MAKKSPHSVNTQQKGQKMVKLQLQRKKNLRVLIERWEGPTKLGKKLRYSGPSFLSQLVGPTKCITEKTARFIEQELDIMNGWLDVDHGHVEQSTRVNTELISDVMVSITVALEGAALPPEHMAELVTLVYEHALEHGGVVDTYTRRLIKLSVKSM